MLSDCDCDETSPSLPPDVADVAEELSDVSADADSDLLDLPGDVSETDFFFEDAAGAEAGPGAVWDFVDGAAASKSLGRDQFTVATITGVTAWLHAATGTGMTGMELYSPPRVLPKVKGLKAAAERFGSFSFDIMQGWNFDLEELRKLTLSMVETGRVRFLYLSPPCTMFSELTRLWNRKRMTERVYEQRMAIATTYMEHSMMAAAMQCEKGLYFMLEHPQKASSWCLACVDGVRRLPGVMCVDFDMCAVGMVSPLGSPIRKRTRVMTNSKSLANILRCKQCSRDHKHRQIKGQELGHSLGKWCQVYPEPLCEILASVFHGE